LQPFVAGAYRPGPILEREDAVHHLMGVVARSYLATPSAHDATATP
jgi:hypothetical protein